MRYLTATALLLASLTGCATNWHHPAISNPEEEARQLAIDEGYCLQAAHGSVPMPQVSYANDGSGTTHFQASGNTYYSNGASSYGTYSGTSTTYPSAGNAFASGVANGMNMGVAIAAKKARDKAFKSCMFIKGWLDSPQSNTAATAELPLPSPPFALSNIHVYPSPLEAWLADVDEFLAIFPEYMESTELYRKLDQEVKNVANLVAASTTGSQILLSAHDNLIVRGEVVEKNTQGKDLLTQIYRSAVGGSPSDQNAMSIALFKGMTPFFENRQRAFVWARKTATRGDPIGLQTAGLLLFYGFGTHQDRINGYRLVAKSAQQGDDFAKKILESWESEMPPTELAVAKEGLN